MARITRIRYGRLRARHDRAAINGFGRISAVAVKLQVMEHAGILGTYNGAVRWQNLDGIEQRPGPFGFGAAWMLKNKDIEKFPGFVFLVCE